MGDKILLLVEGVRALDGGYCNPGGDWTIKDIVAEKNKQGFKLENLLIGTL